ncbi:hypothetical protein GGX14DRAFT_380026 [Mycena pura]|uniref:Uncharacterized protein n=1 Tax=Mycena pura TaxID=153505 RepID=A0AAD6UQL2_9AGAR|nr:hypothetical protein GGX14DRAFT_380026 [Mycena pura]
MHKEWTDCKELMERTANTLTDDTLRLLFVSVQQNNIDLCASHAVRRCVEIQMETWSSAQASKLGQLHGTASGHG